MSVNPKDKKMLQQNWDGAKETGGNLPDGTYQFKIIGARFHMSDKGKPQFKTKLELIGGDEELKGEKLEINDNLETSDNMGWFKKKLRRLNIVPPEDVTEITDGTVAEQLEGKTFEGQVKTKNDFMNVYVNRLLSENGKTKDTDESEEKEEEKEEAQEEEKEVSIEEGSQVTWGNGKIGEVIEVLADDEQARVKKEDGSVVRVDLSKLTIAEKEEAEEEDEQEEEKSEEKDEDSEDGEFELPAAEDVLEMKMPDVKKALSVLGFDADDTQNPRGVLRGFCALAEDPKAKLELSEVKPLCAALGLEPKKAEQLKDTTRRILKAVTDRIG